MTAGTMLLVWMGELITENGIGNGISIIIFGGIVAVLPSAVGTLVTGGSIGRQRHRHGLLRRSSRLITIVGIVLINEGQRRIPVHHAKRVRAGRHVRRQHHLHPAQGQLGRHDPADLRRQHHGLPGHDRATSWQARAREWVRELRRRLSAVLQPEHASSTTSSTSCMVVGFTYFYTMVIFQQQKIPENLQRQGAFIPGVRPGQEHGDLPAAGA